MQKKLKTTSYRSNMMSKIRSTDGKAEVLMRKMLWHEGVRYRKNYKVLPGKPDIAITKYKIVIFIDGEFWHGFDWKNQKKIRIHRNREYWIPKIEKNMARDRKQEQELKKCGWIVIRFWEKHDFFKNPEKCLSVVMKTIKQCEIKSSNGGND